VTEQQIRLLEKAKSEFAEHHAKSDHPACVLLLRGTF